MHLGYPVFNLRTNEKDDQCQHVSELFGNVQYFIGVTDVKYFRTKCLPKAACTCQNYKAFHSVALQVVADEENKFISVDDGHFGRNSNRIFFHIIPIHVAGRLKFPEPRQISSDTD